MGAGRLSVARGACRISAVGVVVGRSSGWTCYFSAGIGAIRDFGGENRRGGEERSCGCRAGEAVRGLWAVVSRLRRSSSSEACCTGIVDLAAKLVVTLGVREVRTAALWCTLAVHSNDCMMDVVHTAMVVGVAAGPR